MRDPRTIGVLTPLVSGPYFGVMLTGIAAEAATLGLRPVVIQTLDAAIGDTHPGIPQLRAHIGRERLDGVLVVTNAVHDDYVAELTRHGTPVVLASHEIPDFPGPAVCPDNRGGVAQAVTHLIEHGHTRIAFAGFLNQADLRERHEAYRATMAAHGLQARTIDAGDSMDNGGERAARALLDAGLPVTAVVAGNDLNAIGLMRGLRAGGVRVPEDVAVVGFDDTPMAEHQNPALSTVNQETERVGARAVRMLAAVMDGEVVEPGRHPVPISFVPRRSCGCSAESTAPLSPPAAGLDDAPRESEPADAPRESVLADRLRRRLGAITGLEPDAATGAACQAVARAVVAAADGPWSAETLPAAIETIYRAHPRGETIAAVVATVQEAVRALVRHSAERETARERVDACLHEIALGLATVRARDEAEVTRHLQDALRHGYDISFELLRAPGDAPASLAWLHSSPVVVGCLALWTEGGAAGGDLEIVSTFGPGLDGVAGPITVTEFPPAPVIAAVDDNPGTTVVVLPVKTGQHDWGLLALVGPPESRSLTGRETYFQWAAMLSIALDHQTLVRSLHQQREDLAEAYRRERELAESIRSSEERYALAAAAASDGLWDWDLVDDTTYYSPRWAAMLGFAADGITTAPSEWLGRVHPDDAATLHASIEQCRSGVADAMEHEHRVRGHDGAYRWVLCRALAVPGDGEPATRLVGSMTDITDRRALEDQLRRQALYDTLTGLPNRALFLDRLGRALARHQRHATQHFAVVFLDLDGFKVVNDSLGHTTGDLLLQQVAERITATLRGCDTAARLGGDEFTVLLEDVIDLEAVPEIVRKIQEQIATPYQVAGNSLVVSVSAGVATSAFDHARAEDVLRDADIAMYNAKRTARGSCVVFDPSMHDRAMNRLRIESGLRRALEAGELTLRVQPIVDMTSEHITALEALVRWDRPDGREISPGEFLPIAEESGLIVPLGRSVIGQACRQLAAWRDAGVLTSPLPMSVNVSHREFWHPDLLEHLTTSLDACGLGPEWLTIEITEGVLMRDVDNARALLDALHAAGLRLHIDDFGTGYSSLEALHRFPIDALKIDRSFVSRLEQDPRSRELVSTIVTMARGLDIDVIAEGVETREQLGLLLQLGCRRAQGYLFARPMRPADLARVLPLDGA